MIPIVVRSTEEMLRLVPDDLREASYALGVPKWRTIVKVVLPTALGGIVTGVTLVHRPCRRRDRAAAADRGSDDAHELQRLLRPHDHAARPDLHPERQPRHPAAGGGDPPGIAIAWGGAFVLIVIVMMLNLIARVIGKIFAPAKTH